MWTPLESTAFAVVVLAKTVSIAFRDSRRCRELPDRRDDHLRCGPIGEDDHLSHGHIGEGCMRTLLESGRLCRAPIGEDLCLSALRDGAYYVCLLRRRSLLECLG